MIACRARLAGNSGAIAKNSNAAAAAQEQPNVEIILTRVLTSGASATTRILSIPIVTIDVTANPSLSCLMIVSFRDKRTREFAHGRYVKAFSGFFRQAEIKLDQLDAAVSLQDLAALPGNRFEALKGDRKGQYSVRINDQWRICFEWPAGSPGAMNVEIVDYH